jgi:hypothetical protein
VLAAVFSVLLMLLLLLLLLLLYYCGFTAALLRLYCCL